MDLVFDIETDDLKATKIHCIVAQDVDSGQTYKFPPDTDYKKVMIIRKADKLNRSQHYRL